MHGFQACILLDRPQDICDCSLTIVPGGIVQSDIIPRGIVQSDIVQEAKAALDCLLLRFGLSPS